jgi:hypothetical protein
MDWVVDASESRRGARDELRCSSCVSMACVKSTGRGSLLMRMP